MTESQHAPIVHVISAVCMSSFFPNCLCNYRTNKISMFDLDLSKIETPENQKEMEAKVFHSV